MGQRKLRRQIDHVEHQTTCLAQMRVALEQSKRGVADRERAQATRNKIQLGGLLVVSGLLFMDMEVVLGALLRARACQDKPAKLQSWRRTGQRAFADWKRTGKDPTIPPIPQAWNGGSPATNRKRMNRQLIEWGGLIQKAGLGDWDGAIILGVLLNIARHRNDLARVNSWKHTAMAAAAAKHHAQSRIKPLKVEFSGRIPRTIGRELRKLGLQFKRTERIWLGEADPAAAWRIANPAGGEVLYLDAGPWGFDPRFSRGKISRRSGQELRDRANIGVEGDRKRASRATLTRKL